MSFPLHTPPIVMEAKHHDAAGKKATVVAAAMRRSGSKGRNGGAESSGKAAVAVDGDKSSQHALKWAADHVLARAQTFYLLHVRRKNSLHPAVGKQFSTSHVQDDVAASLLAQMDLQTKELLLPFQCFCSRRGLQCREVILEGTEVSKAIVDFVVQHNIDKIVLGSSSRSAFTRTIWKMDVATSVTKYAPNFCSVYVIAKGKLSTFRPATQANENDTSKEDMNADAPENRLLAAKSEPAHKFPGEEQHSYRLMATHAALHIGTHFDESTEHGNLKAPVQQRSGDSYLSKTASCPSEFIRIVNKQGNHLSPEYPENRRDTLFLLNKDNERAFQAPHEKYLGIDDNALSLEYNAYGLSTPSGECASSSSKYQAEYVEADPRRLQKMYGNMLRNYKELPLGTEDGIKNSYAAVEREDNPLLGRQVAELSSAVCGPKHKLLTLETLSSDPQRIERITEEFMDHSAEKQVHPMLRRLPPKFFSPRNDKYGSAPEEKHVLELNCTPLPTPIETKRILECLPTRLQCRLYSANDIANATDHFSEDLKVGEGGYGPVYKATLDNTLVAVKILHSNVTQGLKAFQQEIDLLNNLRHPNMVHLVGACPEYGCLVYEYMPNGSLEDRLYCRSGTPPLPWKLRFKIAVELAIGLLYLHKMKPEAFVHRDLKPGNILLDKKFVCKIADVGLARIIPKSMDDTKTQYRMTDAAGTFCYIDPEYQKTGLVSTKSDVYALGIIYLQIITAKDAMGLAYAVSDALEEGTFHELLDSKVTDWPVEEAKKFAELALKCCELRHRDRPDLESVVLPELVRLLALAAPSEDPSMGQPHHRSASDKDLALDDGLAEILTDASGRAASFSA